MIGKSYSSYIALAFLLFATIVTAKTPTAKLTCESNKLSLAINKTEIEASGRNYTVKFAGQNDNDCMFTNINFTSDIDEMVTLSSNYSDCGIGVYEDGDNIVYNQTVFITYGKNPENSIIQRVETDQFKLKCEKTRNFTKTVDKINVTEISGGTVDKVGNTTFAIELGRYESEKFEIKDTSERSELGKTFYFQLKLATSKSEITMSPQNCYATKEDGTGKHYLIQDKCANKDDGTTSILTDFDDTKLFQWKNEAFRYFGYNSQIYIKCDVLVCLGTEEKQCKRCGAPGARKRREVSNLNGEVEVVGATKKVTVSSGLIVLVHTTTKDNSPSEASSVFSGTKGTIIIVLLAVLVLFVAIAVMKKFFFANSTYQISEAPTKSMNGVYENKGMA